jgi:hypothetical protein
MDENIVIIEPNPNSRTAMRAVLATAARSFEPLARRTLAHWKSTDEVPVASVGTTLIRSPNGELISSSNVVVLKFPKRGGNDKVTRFCCFVSRLGKRRKVVEAPFTRSVSNH